MSLKESVYSVLVVSNAKSLNASLRTLLPDFKFSPICFESSISSAKRTLLERHFDFVIINSPLPDDPGLSFAIDLCHEKSMVALLLVKTELYTATYEKVAEHGVYVLSKPLAKSVLLQAVDWMVSTHGRLKKLEKKTMSIEDKMKEIRTVNRGQMAADRPVKNDGSRCPPLLEKQAMDSCMSKKAVAEDILKTYA